MSHPPCNLKPGNLDVADSEDEWPSSQTLLPKEKGFKVGFPRPKGEGEGEGIQSVHTQIQQCRTLNLENLNPENLNPEPLNPENLQP
jgi:hypothetical protein